MSIEGDWTLLAVAAAMLLYAFIAHDELRQALRGWVSPPPAAHLPSLTVICPIKGLDAGAPENIRAVLDLDYPGPLELLFVLDDDAEPALPLLRSELSQIDETRPERP